jgi:Zn-dependent peptidase ImmA (M78 family)
MLLFSKDLQIILRDYNPDLETEADWLGGCLLLPREALALIKRDDISDFEACETYSVSQELLTYRVNMTGINRQLAYVRK